jgi:hypothetical protein
LSPTLDRDPLPPVDICRDELMKRVQQIPVELKKLHDSLRTSDPLATDV